MDSASKYNLLDELDEVFVCGICSDIAEEPWQHDKCGQLFCKKCLGEHGMENKCPKCQEQSRYFEDHKSQFKR